MIFAVASEMPSKCELLRELQETKRYIKEAGQLLHLPGKTVVACEDNGDFSPVQCIEHICECVDLNGKPIGTATFYVWEQNTCSGE